MSLYRMTPRIRSCSSTTQNSVFGIGIPMLAGPGAISTVMVLIGQSRNWWQAIPVFAAIGMVLFFYCGKDSSTDGSTVNESELVGKWLYQEDERRQEHEEREDHGATPP